MRACTPIEPVPTAAIQNSLPEPPASRNTFCFLRGLALHFLGLLHVVIDGGLKEGDMKQLHRRGRDANPFL
jgi:hypothetical protein